MHKDLKNHLRNKPHFYYKDIDNYNDIFLKDMLFWQKEYINLLKQKLKNLKKLKKE